MLNFCRAIVSIVRRRWIVVVILYLLFQNIGVAQTVDKTGNWIMLFSQFRVHEKWSIHAEAQYRDFGIFDEAEQILLRTGVNFHISPLSTATAGYARITNYADDSELLDKPIISEHRLWQQFSMRNSIGRFFFEHRYRLEQRWIETNSGSRHLDRIRYLLRITVPINKKTIEKNTFFLSVYDELFIHFLPAPFDRNRFFGSVGYQFTPSLNIQLGHLSQTVNSTTKNYLQAAVFLNVDIRKKTKGQS